MKQVLLVQPSSAAAKRAFSLLSAAFSNQQESALADYLQASVMLQYNNISADVDLCILFLSMFIQTITGTERTQNCQDKLIYFVAWHFQRCSSL